MDCRYIREYDLGENYLLRRLSEGQRREFEAHVRSCVRCQRELAGQQQLLAALRHAGKQEMKAEIARQVANLQESRPRWNWTAYAKIAVVLFMIILGPTLVYLYRTQPEARMAVFDGSQEQTTFSREALEYAESKSQRPGVSEEAAEAGEKQSMAPAGEQSKDKVPEREENQPAAKVEPRTRLAEPAQERSQTVPRERGSKKGSRQQEATPKVSVPENGASGTDVVEVPAADPDLQDERSQQFQDFSKAQSATHSLRSQYKRSDADSESIRPGRQEAKPQVQAFAPGLALSVGKSEAVWNLDVDGTTIIIYLHYSDAPDRVSDNTWPSAFHYRVVERDSTSIRMNWFVGSSFRRFDDNKMGAELQNEVLLVHLNDSTAYRIRLSKLAGEAVKN